MKVIGIASDGYDPVYIVEVSQDELKAALEKGYREEFKKLKAGDTIDLRTIPGQRERIVAATEKMTAAYAEFVKAAPVMAELARVIANAPATAEAR